MKFSIKDFFSKCDQIRMFPADLVTFTEKIVNGKLLQLFEEHTPLVKTPENMLDF